MPSEHSRGSKIDLALVLFLVAQVAGLVYLGLAPFSFSPPNRVKSLDDPPGLQFSALGIATSQGTVRGAEQFPGDSLSIHFMIEPDDEPRSGLGTILSIEGKGRTAPLIVAQWKSWLVVRVRDPARRNLGYWEINAAGFRVGERHFVTITSGPKSGTAIYIDGVATGDTRGRAIIRREEGFDGRLLLGCLGNGSAGWRGKLFGLAITSTVVDPGEIAAQYDRVRSDGFKALREDRDIIALYDFTSHEPKREELLYSVPNRVADSALGDLEIPAVFAPVRPEAFGVPKLRDMMADWFLRDLLRNIAGFFPFGLIAALILIRRRSGQGYVIALQVAFLGAILSLGIEAVQIALPMRNSSLSDLSLNVIGAAIGAVIALAFRHTPLGNAKA
ncbi:MAG: VanZ family protein [Deltaproteobacteria bacterium]|nr:VanZ family protein [Deltaproteobacteria bacterium]MBW2387025.1 VanZ family protein [Deltaproteobacteria bacterium]MBW2725798.1 VanZ family protein [Deltaproteobacteria bacterium]